MQDTWTSCEQCWNITEICRCVVICVFGLSHLFNFIVISQTSEIPNCRNLQPSFTGLAPSLTENRLEKIAKQQRVHDLQWLPFHHLTSSRLASSSQVILDPTHTNSLDIYRNQSFWIWLHFVPTKKSKSKKHRKQIGALIQLTFLDSWAPNGHGRCPAMADTNGEKAVHLAGIKFRWVWLTSPPFWSIHPPSI